MINCHEILMLDINEYLMLNVQRRPEMFKGFQLISFLYIYVMYNAIKYHTFTHIYIELCFYSKLNGN